MDDFKLDTSGERESGLAPKEAGALCDTTAMEVDGGAKGQGPTNPEEEKHACMAIRRVIQKVWVATPQTFDGLKKELQEVLHQELDKTGAPRVKHQEESDKGLKVVEAHRDRFAGEKNAESTNTGKPAEALEETVELSTDTIKRLFCTLSQ